MTRSEINQKISQLESSIADAEKRKAEAEKTDIIWMHLKC